LECHGVNQKTRNFLGNFAQDLRKESLFVIRPEATFFVLLSGKLTQVSGEKNIALKEVK